MDGMFGEQVFATNSEILWNKVANFTLELFDKGLGIVGRAIQGSGMHTIIIEGSIFPIHFFGNGDFLTDEMVNRS